MTNALVSIPQTGHNGGSIGGQGQEHCKDLVVEQETCKETDRTPRPEDFAANGSTNDEGALGEESPYIDKKHHTSRRGRLSIDNLVRHSSPAEKSRGEGQQTMEPQMSARSTYEDLAQHTREAMNTSGNTSTSFADDSFAALSNASQNADMSAGFLSLGEIGASDMQHNMSMDGSADPSVRYGRTRSGTVRRYPSSNSASSAPPHLGELGGLPGDSFHGSAHASPFMGSNSASDASTQGSPQYLRSALQGQSQSPHLGGNSSWSGTTAASASSASLSRSPPTQHNRKKRNKCSPEQYRQLEAFFANNRNPTGKIREELSKRIKMPERSVQVWFQNKRAKTKLNEIKEGIPPEQRTTVSRPKIQRTASASATGSNEAKKKTTENVQSSPAQEESVIQLPATSLCVGEWRRIKPLICLFSRRNQCFTWYLSSESVGFKLESPRANIKSVTFAGPRTPTLHEFGEGINTELGHLIVELERPPQFYMEVFRSSGREDEEAVQRASWRQCSDFTEGKQATNVLTHIVCGPYALLRAAVTQLQQAGGAVASMVSFQDGVPVMQYNAPVDADQHAWTPMFTPQSAHIDMSGLSLNSAMSSSFETTGVPSAIQYGSMQPWPQSANPLQNSWGTDRYAQPSGAASAPPFQAQGFEQQQTQYNPMSGV